MGTTTTTTTPNSTLAAATTTTNTGNDTTSTPTTASSTTASTTALKKTKKVAMIPRSETIPKTISRSYNIYQIPTHTFCQIYSDRLVVGVTQLNNHNQGGGHIGSWVLCTATQSPTNPTQTEYELSTVLGNSILSTVGEHEKEIYARRITERLLEKAIIIPKGTDKLVVLLGISLLPIPTTTTNNDNDNDTTTSSSSFTSIERFQTLVEVLVELIEETAQL